MGVCILCVGDNEERECGVGTGVNDTMLRNTIEIVGVTESDSMTFLYRLICHLGLLYHYRVSFVLDVPYHF